jgi:outer membrane beta-barrel protein
MKSLLALIWICIPVAHASDTLEDQLQSLKIPDNLAPASISNEQLYSVQSRYTPLKGRVEITLGGAHHLDGNGFFNSSELQFHTRYHFSNRWNLNLGGSYVTNSLTSSGKNLLLKEGLFPDAAYVKYRADLLLGFNVFYGKFRLSEKQVFYFDQYIALGTGYIVGDRGGAPAISADLGFAFWLGKGTSLRLGVKNYAFYEQRLLSRSLTNQIIGHVDFGVLLGDGG